MKITTHNLGFPRIGANRELKFALEKYWRNEIDATVLQQTASELRQRHWQQQADSGLDYLPVGDFSLYDHVLDTSVMLGAVPERFSQQAEQIDLATYFCMARGCAPSGQSARACEMTKWFDTNYHYIVPEVSPTQNFTLSGDKLFAEIEEAQQLGYTVKPVLLGPITWLWLAKSDVAGFDKLVLLEKLIPVYRQLLNRLVAQGVTWVQIDEPALVLDLPLPWRNAYEKTYHQLQTNQINILLASYFDSLNGNLSMACTLPVAGLHIDLVRAPDQLIPVLDNLAHYKTLSLGVVDGRNIWRTDLNRQLDLLESVIQRFPGAVWLAPSCSLLHVPVDLQSESLSADIKAWLAFAAQKLTEIEILRLALVEGRDSAAPELNAARQALQQRQTSAMIHNPQIKQRLGSVNQAMFERKNTYSTRRHKQRAVFQLPLYPTTTIGSFPQTSEIRTLRREYKQGVVDEGHYVSALRKFIKQTVDEQQQLGLDVLVHGEAERNDMVEYFGEHLDGFVFTGQGWVQSYGSRCVKPPIIVGDVSRPKPITVEWIRYAQSLTDKPMKGMLTGPVTMLNWSFVRDDQPRSATAMQLALALRDEVLDLEKAGIHVIQIDEAALREGLPLKGKDQQQYLDWAVSAFRLTASGVKDETQIHTHMCYSEFNDIIEHIAALDADVITIETSRSNMELLDAFKKFDYPNEIGPGVYDIHSPNIPSVEQIVELMQKAGQRIAAEQLWINPDCGLKTRNWEEVRPALKNMVQAAVLLREKARQAATGRVASA